MTGTFIAEILEQPDALARCVSAFPAAEPDFTALSSRLGAGEFDRILLTGMGSSLHACYPSWLYLNRSCSIPTQLWDASELVHFGREAITPRTLLVAVSQSGESGELVQMTRLDCRPALVISVSNGAVNTLAAWSDLQIDIVAGEEATVSTKTYTSTLAALAQLGRLLSGGDVPELQQRILEASSELAVWLQAWETHLAAMSGFFGGVETLTCMGRGASLASARTGALITAESSKVFTQALSSGQFRHGPLELLRPGFSAVVFEGYEPGAALNRQLAGTIVSHGGKCMLVTPRAIGDASPNLLEMPIPQAGPLLLPILEIVPIQFLTIALARARGIEPAMFNLASKITRDE